MAIHAYVGKPGSGKSYGVVERVVIPSLKQGRHVITNIPINVDAAMADFGGGVTLLPEDWWERPDLAVFAENGSVLILDELWRRWPQGLTANKANPADKALLAEHRHMVDSEGKSMRIVLVTQDLSQLASFARTLIEITYRIKKLSKTRYRVDSYSGVVTGDSPPKSKLLNQVFRKYDKNVYGYYRSATKSDTGEVGDESAADNMGSIFRSYFLWVVVFCVLFVLPLGLYGAVRFFSGPAKSDSSAEKIGSPTVTSVPSTPSKPLTPQIKYSLTWRLTGFIHNSIPDPNSKRDSSVAVLISSTGKTRYISFSDCRYYPDFKEAYCDIDNERVTSWTGGGASSPIPFIGGLGAGTAERSVSGSGG